MRTYSYWGAAGIGFCLVIGSTTIFAKTYNVGQVSAKGSSVTSHSKGTGQTISTQATQTQSKVLKNIIQNATNPTSDFTQSIKNQPNILTFISGSSQSGANIHLRGFNSSHLDFTLDGIPVNGAGSGSVYTNEIETNSDLSSVTVAPGAGSASTPGSTDFGGSIKLKTQNPGPKFYIQPSVGYGSYNTRQYGAKLNTGLVLNNTTSILLSAQSQKSNGYFTNDKTYYDNNFTAKSLSHVGPGTLTLYFHSHHEHYNYYNGITRSEKKKYGIKYSGYNSNPHSGNYYGYGTNKFREYRTYGKYKVHKGAITASDQFYYYFLRGYGGYGLGFGPIYHVRDYDNGHNIGNISKLQYKTKYVTLKGGAYWRRANFDHYANPTAQFGPSSLSEFYNERVITSTFQPYIEAPIHLFNDRLTIKPGLKYSHVVRTFNNNLKPNSGHKHAAFNNLLPSFGMNFSVLKGWHLYFNYTRSFKPPNYSQFYSGRFNPNLKPEIANSYELGSTWDQGRWSGKFTLYETHFLSYIRSKPVNIAGSTKSLSQLQNTGGRINQGASLINNYKITNWLSGFVNIGYLNAYYPKGNYQTTYSPHTTDSIGLHLQHKRWNAGISAKYTSSYKTSLYGSKYYTVNGRVGGKAYVGYTIKGKEAAAIGAKSISFKVNVSNLFDQQNVYSASGSPANPRRKYQKPINAFGRVSIRF